MMNNDQLFCNILTYINNTGANEQAVAKQFFDGRVLQSRHALQCMLWQGIIVGNAGAGYQLSPLAKEIYKQALMLVAPHTKRGITSKK